MAKLNKQLTFDFYNRTFDWENYFKVMLPMRVRETTIPLIPPFPEKKPSWFDRLTDYILGD